MRSSSATRCKEDDELKKPFKLLPDVPESRQVQIRRTSMLCRIVVSGLQKRKRQLQISGTVYVPSVDRNPLLVLIRTISFPPVGVCRRFTTTIGVACKKGIEDS